MTNCYWLLLLRQKNNLSDRFDNIVGQAIQRAIRPWKSRQIGWGGWLRNSDKGLGVFLKVLGTMSSYMAELWAIRDGLLRAPDLRSPTCL